MTDNNNIKTITHSASGSSCRVHALGATVLSFDASGRNHLFLSKQAILDGSAPIRGGIPICFPIFGPATYDNMPQHGFARRNLWKIVDGSEFDDETAAGVTYSLTLKDVVDGRGSEEDLHNPWSKAACEKDDTDSLLLYEIRVEAKQLITTLIIQNTGKSNFDFNALLHTYYAVDNELAFDTTKTFVQGLGGYSITDKVSGDVGNIQSYDEPVVLKGEVDRVFIHPEDHPTAHVKLASGCGEATLQLEAAGQVDDTVSPVSCVVWNPSESKAASMKDFGDNEYKSMICVEPGLIGHQPLLIPGREARLTQSIIVLGNK